MALSERGERLTLFRTNFSNKSCPAIVNTKHGANIPSVITTAPAKAIPIPPVVNPPWKPTKVAKMTSGAGRMFPIAIQSRKTWAGSHAPLSTASTWMNGMAVYAPPKDKLPATRPRARRLGRLGVLQIPRARETGDGMPRNTT